MRFNLLLLTALLATSAAAAPRDWKAYGKEMDKLRIQLESQGCPTEYVLAGQTVPATPELGINIHNLTDRAATDLQAAHLRYVRQTIYWQNLEKKAGQYDQAALARLDEMVNKYFANQLIPLFVVHGTAPGVSFANRTAAYERFGALMTMLAKRYPQVKYWELWNEMDVAFTPLFGAKDKVPMKQRAAYYTEMLKIAYPAIKKANPQAIVLTGGMTDCKEFPEGIYAAGGKDYFDIMNIHTYGVPLFWSFIDRGNQVRRIMNANGDNRKPLWLSEFGVSNDAIVRAWGIPKNETLTTVFDQQQNEMLTACVSFNQKAGLYHRYFIYAYQSATEAGKNEKEKLLTALPPGSNLNDYSFGISRSSDNQPRLFLKNLIEHPVNP